MFLQITSVFWRRSGAEPTRGHYSYAVAILLLLNRTMETDAGTFSLSPEPHELICVVAVLCAVFSTDFRQTSSCRYVVRATLSAADHQFVAAT